MVLVEISLDVLIQLQITSTLRQRLMARGLDDTTVIDKRLKNARAEMDRQGMYRHIVVNDDLDAARKEGMRTAYINRPTEYGTDQVKDFEADAEWDIITDHIGGIADALGC